MSCLRRGVIAGAAGGALAGVFEYALAAPVMDRAVRLESAREDAEHAAQEAAGQAVAHHAEVFSRGTQHLGLLVASLATGVALGVLFGVLFGVLYAARRRAHPAVGTGRDGWRRALALGGAAWFAVYVVPFLRYPANPPGVGDPDTIDSRTHAYLAAVAIGVLGVVAAVRLAGDLRRRGSRPSHRQLAVVGVLAASR